MKPCSRRCVQLWTNTDKAASEVVAVFDAVRNPQADSFHAGWPGNRKRRAASVDGVWRRTSAATSVQPGEASVCPHASNALSAEPPSDASMFVKRSSELLISGR